LPTLPWVLLQTSNDSHAHRLYTTLAHSENRSLYAHCLTGKLHCEVSWIIVYTRCQSARALSLSLSPLHSPCGWDVYTIVARGRGQLSAPLLPCSG
jgi:hypothetical protein